jgi:cellulose biosynthesis protein BcsQ
MALNNICFRYFVEFAIIPFSSDVFSVDGYGDIMDVLDKARQYNPVLSVMGAYLSRYRKSEAVEQYIREQLLQFGTFIDIQIPYAADVRESVMFGRPISFFKQNSKSRTAYEALTDYMRNKELV